MASQPGRSWKDSRGGRGDAARGSSAGGPPAGAGTPGGAARGSPPEGAGRASWRDKSAPAVAQRGKARHWLVRRADHPGRFRHRAKLLVAMGVLAALFAAFLIKVLWGPRNTPLLLIGVLDYASPAPPNAWTEEDFARFRALEAAGSGSQNIRVHADLGERQWRVENQALAAIEQQLKLRSMQPGGPEKKTVLIYLSGHGVLDAEGRPCVLLATDRGNADTWQPQLDRLDDMPLLSLQSVVATIEKCYADDVYKVLLLDCSRIDTSAQLGILVNRFGEALKSLEINDENLFVLSSADAGQVGWALPERRASVFGYYVGKGLQGRADDSEHGGDGDGIVTLGELHGYLHKEVGEQVQAHYLAQQSPILLPERSSDRAAATPLSWSHDEETEQDAGGEPPAVPWSKVDELWARHYELKQTGAQALGERSRYWISKYLPGADPQRANIYRGPDLLSFEAFQQGLLRLEQLNDAGRHYQNEARQLFGSLELMSKAFGGPSADKLRPELALRNVTVLPEVQAQLEEVIKRQPKEPAIVEALRTQIPSEQRAKATWAYWLKWADSIGLGGDVRADFKRAADVLESASPVACEPVEIRFLRLIDPGGLVPAEVFSGQAMALRSAILSRDLAEAAAWAADDVRAHYAVAPIVARGDAARRSAEDELFIRPTALAANGQPWRVEPRNAEKHYKQALELAVQLSAAIEARDQTAQELPYLALWLARRQETENQRGGVAQQLATCARLFAENQQLAVSIDRLMEKCLTATPASETADRFVADLGETRTKLVEQTATVRGDLNSLTGYHADAISDCRDASAKDPANLRRIRDLLSTPLLTGAPAANRTERGGLRDRLLESRKDVRSLSARGRPEGAPVVDAATAAPLKEHPLAALFGDASAPEPNRTAGKIRADLHKAFADLAAVPTVAIDGTVERIARLKLSKSEHTARSFAALWTLGPAYSDVEKQLHDPIGTMAGFDRHHAILWQAARALEDFWGKQNDPQQALYFESLTNVALDEARQFGPEDRGAEYKRIEQLLADRRSAATEWAKIALPSQQLPATGSQRTIETQPAISFSAKVPSGAAALVAHRPDRQPAEMRFGENDPWQPRLAVAAPLTRTLEPLSFTLPEQLAAAGEPWPVQLYYRGHVQRTSLVLSRLEPGQRLVFDRVKPRPPRIFVNGEQRDPGSVSLIFDSSGSMGSLLPNRRRIMDVAKDALRQTIEEMADANSYRLSLWFYGHRLGYDKSQSKVLNVCTFFAAEPAKRQRFPREWCQYTGFMSEDVALEWPLNPNGNALLTPNNIGEVNELIDAVQPLGVTPLYFAIVRAVETDKNLKPHGAPRRLIVLTDGKNEVYRTEKRPELAPGHVVAALNNAGPGIETHIIGFGDVAREDEAQRTLRGILRDIKQPVNYHAVSPDLGDFEDVIRRAIGLKKYEVFADQERIGEQKVNRQMPLNKHRGPTRYTVRILGSDQPHRMALEGGEHIDLFVSEDSVRSPRLVHARPDTSETQAHTLASVVKTGQAPAADAAKFFVGFQQPEPISGETKFRVWIQHEDERLFTPRPAEAWIEITPLADGAKKHTPYVFYDLEFEDGKPVPMLVCRAAGWPAEARSARVEVFFKMKQTNTEHRKRVREVEGERPDPSLAVRLPDGRRVQFSVKVSALSGQEGTQVLVTERCARPEDLRRAKVEIETPADSIQRTYYHSPGQCEVQHEFVFSGQTPDEVRDFWLRVTSREDLEADAAKLHDIVELKWTADASEVRGTRQKLSAFSYQLVQREIS